MHAATLGDILSDFHDMPICYPSLYTRTRICIVEDGNKARVLKCCCNTSHSVVDIKTLKLDRARVQAIC